MCVGGGVPTLIETKNEIKGATDYHTKKKCAHCSFESRTALQDVTQVNDFAEYVFLSSTGTARACHQGELEFLVAPLGPSNSSNGLLRWRQALVVCVHLHKHIDTHTTVSFS